MTLSSANYAEIFATLICTYCFVRKPSFFNRWFTPFLWFTLMVELTGKLMTYDREGKMLLYNIFNFIEIVFYLLVFYFVSPRQERTVVLPIFITVASLFCMVNLIWGQGFWQYNSYSLVLGSVLLVISCLREYFRILSSDAEPVFVKWALICITTGLFIFYAGNFAMGTFMAFLIKQYPQTFVMLYKTVNHNLNVFLYLAFGIGFIVELKQRIRIAI